MAIDLSTTARVKAFLGAGGTSLSTAQDTVIAQLIAFYSARFEHEMGRWTKSEARTEQYDIEPGQRMVALKGWPIASIASVKNDDTRTFGSDSVIDPTLYYANLTKGTLQFDWIEPVAGPGALQVVYTAGMAADTTAFITAYPDLAQALDLQVAEVIRRKDRLGATNMSFQGGGFGYEAAVKLLPEVRTTLDLHRRVFIL